MSRHTFFEDLRNDAITGVAYKNLQQKKQILSRFVHTGNATIADLSREMNASVPKVGELVNELMADGLVKDYGKLEAAAGRRPNQYGLEADSVFFVGVDIKQYYVNLALGDFRNNLVRIREKVPFHLKNTPEALDQLCDIIREFIAGSGKSKRKILGIGVNLSGRINYRSGYSYSFFHFQEDPLSKVIEQRLGISTFLENDSRAVAYGEFSSGSYNEKHAVFLNLEHGIGMGMLSNGQLYYGKSGFAGDIGHIPIFDNDILCHCGKKGCLETEASGAALTRTFISHLREGHNSIVANRFPNFDDIQLEDILAAVQQEDTLAISLIAQTGEKLGRGIAVLINLLNPELVIIGGALATAGDYILLPMKRSVNKYALTLANNDAKLVLSRKGEQAGMAGACLLVRDRLLALID